MKTHIQRFDFGSNSIQVLGTPENPLFVAKDVCTAIGLVNVARSLDKLEHDEKGIQILNTLGGRQNVTVINESGLYTLILRSTKPEAKAFKRWVTGEVLPAIRKTGAYGVTSNPEPQTQEKQLRQIQAEMEFMREIISLQKKLLFLTEKTKAPKNRRATISQTDVAEMFRLRRLGYGTTRIGQEIGCSETTVRRRLARKEA